MSALSDLLSAANAGKLSARSIARAAQDRGFTLNHDTAARYLRGDHGRPDEPTLNAFSEVLGVPMQKLRVAADLPAEETAPYNPPPEASRLNRRQRKAVDEIIRAMVDASGRPDAVTAIDARRPQGRAAAKAARRGAVERHDD